MQIPEHFLQYIWQTKNFDFRNLICSNGDQLSILKFGTLNLHDGPDFKNAHVRINDTEWYGDVEIHSRSSEWNTHNHMLDKNYNTVILHVVWENDLQILHSSSQKPIPTLELRGKISKHLLDNYLQLKESLHVIPCENLIQRASSFTIINTLSEMATKKLAERSKFISGILEDNKYDWEETFFRLISRNLGFYHNGETMYKLAEKIPFKLIKKYAADQQKVHAIVFGTSGILEKYPKDAYAQSLKKEFNLFSKIHSLSSLSITEWKFLRLRPANFPSIRIAQLVEIFRQNDHLFTKIVQSANVKEIQKYFKVTLPEYWKTHYTFGSVSTPQQKYLGNTSLNLIIINTVAPLMYTYGMKRDRMDLVDKASQLLEKIPAESNRIINKWKSIGVIPRNSLESQGIIYLQPNFCEEKKCLSCKIGHQVLKQVEE